MKIIMRAVRQKGVLNESPDWLYRKGKTRGKIVSA